MKYILLIYGDERVWARMSREELENVLAEHMKYSEEMAKAGVLQGGAELQPVATASTIRFENGRRRTLDGPFAETKEQLGGYYLIEVENLDEAIAWAEKMPGMTEGAVEIRPLGAT